jgi:hypothetical protein
MREDGGYRLAKTAISCRTIEENVDLRSAGEPGGAESGNGSRSAAAQPVDATSINSYWDQRYRGEFGSDQPTSFALDVESQLGGKHLLIDLGCGNGRDSLFFASQFHDVLAIDASRAALEKVDLAAREKGLGNVSTLQVDLDYRAHYRAVAAAVSDWRERSIGPVTAYSRFLLHAVTPKTQTVLLESVSPILQSGERWFFEYRTGDMRQMHFVYGNHYRRAIDPGALRDVAEASGLQHVTTDVSDAFAPYGNERPLCARTVLMR